MFWYHDELDRLEKEKNELTFTPNTLFYGSSSFTLWDELTDLFQEHKPLNLAFGGSTLAACSWFFKKNFKGLQPKSILIYAGENDLGNGRHPEEVVLFFKTLLMQIREKYNQIPVTFISIKPSPNRWHLEGIIRYTNDQILALTKQEKDVYYIDIYKALLNASGEPNRSFFIQDGLHLNKKGYKIWYDIISSHTASFPMLTYL